MSLLLTLLLSAGTSGAIPEQNIRKPALETITPFDARPLVNEINASAASGQSAALYFPASAFNDVKGIQDPAAYHRQLLKWFDADIERERKRLSAGVPWAVDGFKLGSCKWKEKGSEANALPYWSCYKSKVKLRNARNEVDNLDVRVLINWGTAWWVTHLGPIPKA